MGLSIEAEGVNQMKTQILLLTAGMLMATGALAEKPQWAGKGKPDAEQRQVHKEAMTQKNEAKAALDQKQKDKIQKQKKEKKVKPEQGEDPKGLEKQQVKKAEQEQKEMDKGSEQGQSARETRKKWWKFWGE